MLEHVKLYADSHSSSFEPFENQHIILTGSRYIRECEENLENTPLDFNGDDNETE